jgi:exopolysaccharide production protein ExoY
MGRASLAWPAKGAGRIVSFGNADFRFDRAARTMSEPSMTITTPLLDDRRSTRPAIAPLRSGVKRCFDIALTALVLVFASPLFVVIALAIKLTDGGPVFYRQARMGAEGKTFQILKFRSMVTDADARLRALLETDAEAAAEWAQNHKLRKDPRITSVGAFLRRSSLDEIPQLWNILVGDMSIVGPRPWQIGEADGFMSAADVALYARTRPGLTGLWQVSGRSDTTLAERIALDSRYVRGWSFWKDIAIILKTIPVVLFSKGAY